MDLHNFPIFRSTRKNVLAHAPAEMLTAPIGEGRWVMLALSSMGVGLSCMGDGLSSMGVGLSSMGVGLICMGVGLSSMAIEKKCLNSMGFNLSSIGVGISSMGVGFSSMVIGKKCLSSMGVGLSSMGVGLSSMGVGISYMGVCLRSMVTGKKSFKLQRKWNTSALGLLRYSITHLLTYSFICPHNNLVSHLKLVPGNVPGLFMLILD